VIGFGVLAGMAGLQLCRRWRGGSVLACVRRRRCAVWSRCGVFAAARWRRRKLWAGRCRGAGPRARKCWRAAACVIALSVRRETETETYDIDIDMLLIISALCLVGVGVLARWLSSSAPPALHHTTQQTEHRADHLVYVYGFQDCNKGRGGEVGNL